MTWVDPAFERPARLDLPTGHHLRPIRAADAEIDLPAVMATRDRLWRQYGEAWGWPPESMTVAVDRQDLAHHEEEMRAGEGFNYAILDAAETELLGCVYVYPSEADADADVSWWLDDEALGTELERELDARIPAWLAEAWNLSSIRRHP